MGFSLLLLAALAAFGILIYNRLARLYLVAMGHLREALGETDTAFAQLEQALAERRGLLVYLRIEPIFDPIRTDVRFADLDGRLPGEEFAEEGLAGCATDRSATPRHGPPHCRPALSALSGMPAPPSLQAQPLDLRRSAGSPGCR